MPFRGGRNNSEPHRTISQLRAENRELQTEIRMVAAEKAKQDKLVDELQAAVDTQDNEMREELLDLRQTERQLARELKAFHAAHIKQETHLQAEIAQLQERCSDLQKSKAVALTAAMAFLQRSLDEDMPRPKQQRDPTSLLSPGRGDAFPRAASSDAPSPKGESMEESRDAPAAAAGPDDAVPAPASCQAVRVDECAVRLAAELLEEPQGLPLRVAPEADV